MTAAAAPAPPAPRPRAPLLDRLEEGLLALLLASMTGISFVQVVARYVFNYSFTWALELTTYLFGGPLDFTSDYPEDLQSALDRIRQESQ